jgi:hypothetical protein
VDRWFVEDVPGPGSTIGAAIGRFPAWSVSELESMVTKTIQYETAEARSWAARSLAAADYHEDDGTLFEDNTHSLQAILSPQWPDTLTVYVRPGTLYSRDRTEFRNLWNQGAAVITLMGHMNWAKFTHESYFTTWEVDSLADNTPLAFCLLTAGQRYERPDSIPIAVNLLRAPTKGAIATLAPSGLTYVGDHQGFVEEFARQAVKNTGRPIGIALLSAINSIHPESFWDERNETLLGDPALVLKHRTLAGTTTTTGSVPEVSMLLQNYPNPFNPSTTIEYSVAEVRGHLPAGQAGASGVSRVRLTVYDVLGREVAVLVDGQQAPGRYSVMFDGSNLTTGVYLCRLQAGNTTVSKKLMLAR